MFFCRNQECNCKIYVQSSSGNSGCLLFLVPRFMFVFVYKQSEYPPAVQKHTHRASFSLLGSQEGLWNFYRLLLRGGTVVVCEHFSICSIVIFPNSTQIKRSCCLWQTSLGCTINSRKDHLLHRNSCYIKAAMMAQSQSDGSRTSNHSICLVS